MGYSAKFPNMQALKMECVLRCGCWMDAFLRICLVGNRGVLDAPAASAPATNLPPMDERHTSIHNLQSLGGNIFRCNDWQCKAEM